MVGSRLLVVQLLLSVAIIVGGRGSCYQLTSSYRALRTWSNINHNL